MAIDEAELSDDPLAAYDNALIEIEFLDTENDTRLTLTKEYALRILEFRQRMYEEMVYRDLSSAPVKARNTDTENLEDTPSDIDEEVEDILSLLDVEEIEKQ